MNHKERRLFIFIRIHNAAVFLLLLGAYLLMFLEFRKHRFVLAHHVLSSALVYCAWFITLLPTASIYLVTMLRSEVTETAKQELTLRLLFRIGTAYMALVFITLMLDRLYRQ
jgi:hypothetical protein